MFSIGDVAVSIGEAATPWCVLLRERGCVYRGSCNTFVCFCCGHVAVSIGEAATSLCLYRKLQQPRFLLRRRCRVYRRSCDVAVSKREAATPCVFCIGDVAVSIGEAATPSCFAAERCCVSRGKTMQNYRIGTCCCKLCSIR